MPIQLLPCDTVVALEAGVVYALPAVKVALFTDMIPPTSFRVSNTPTFTNQITPTFTSFIARVAGAFLKSFQPGNVIIKRD